MSEPTQEVPVKATKQNKTLEKLKQVDWKLQADYAGKGMKMVVTKGTKATDSAIDFMDGVPGLKKWQGVLSLAMLYVIVKEIYNLITVADYFGHFLATLWPLLFMVIVKVSNKKEKTVEIKADEEVK